uniref:Uncharacterized protein n=1 Tax=Nelumbo nucifera TaxID=4432 RepID=A0A822YVF8_NELNU|nr:TPA_asm: hypothetical protein HUJ06_007303 [Nelumbo nucifera]
MRKIETVAFVSNEEDRKLSLVALRKKTLLVRFFEEDEDTTGSVRMRNGVSKKTTETLLHSVRMRKKITIGMRGIMGSKLNFSDVAGEGS